MISAQGRLVIYIHLALIMCVLLASGCSSVDIVNRQVNGYAYLSDEDYGKHGYKRMSPTQPGDCEDHAYTKCLILKELEPDTKVSLLYRVGHIALEVNGQVLDNQHRRTYKYSPDEWDLRLNFNCEDLEG